MNPTVYLAGPISGESYGGATDWRIEMANTLKDLGITAYSPMRGKVYLLNETSIEDRYDQYYLSTIQAIMSRDYFDVNRADALIVNLVGAKKVSIGTVMEVAWAYTNHKPVVLIMEKEGNIHHHGMLMQACAYHVETVEEAMEAIVNVLLP